MNLLIQRSDLTLSIIVNKIYGLHQKKVGSEVDTDILEVGLDLGEY